LATEPREKWRSEKIPDRAEFYCKHAAAADDQGIEIRAKTLKLPSLVQCKQKSSRVSTGKNPFLLDTRFKPEKVKYQYTGTSSMRITGFPLSLTRQAV